MFWHGLTRRKIRNAGSNLELLLIFQRVFPKLPHHDSQHHTTHALVVGFMSHDTGGQHVPTVNRSLDKPVYGNFHRYYHIRNPAGLDSSASTTDVHPALALDSRVAAILRYLSSLPESWHSVTAALDIGCNVGKLTIQLAQTLAGQPESGELRPICVTGVDIDPSLISQAREAAARARSLYRPNEQLETQQAETASHPASVAAQPHLPVDAAFFPSVFPLLFGAVSAPRRINDRDEADAETKKDSVHCAHLCAPQLDFVAAEWVNLHTSDAPSPFHYDPHDLSRLQAADSAGYDVVLALSLTKWVHIQQGDPGLVKLFARIFSVLRPGGHLFLERQEWRSYHSAHGLDPTMRSKIKALQLRPDGDFEWLLDSLGLTLVETIGYGTGLGFSRPLQVFAKRKEVSVEMAEHFMCYSEQGLPWVARSSASHA